METLAEAMALTGECARDYRFVTRAGEVVDGGMRDDAGRYVEAQGRAG